jgi:thymidylate synthase (FAD)
MNKCIDLYGDGIGKVELVEYMGSDLTVVNSARVSFGKHKEVLDDNDKKLVDYLIRHRHTSVLEHNFVTFRFKVPLFVRSQHHRHRTWSYNEISRRYTEFNIEFYQPKEFRKQHKTNRQASTDETFDPSFYSASFDKDFKASTLVAEHYEDSLHLFNKLIDGGVCKEQARMVLPQAMYTEYYGSANLSNILKFVDLRLHEGAQLEIQQVAQAVLDIVTELYPETVGAYRRIRDEKHGS